MTSNDEQHFGFVGTLIGRSKKCLFPEQAGMAPSKSNSANPNGNGKRNKSRAKRSQLTGDSSLLVAATSSSRLGCVEVGASLQHLFKENEAPVVNQRRIIQKMDSLAGVFEVNDNSLSREIQKSLAGECSRSRGRSSLSECSLANNAGDAQRHRETKVFAQSQVQKHPSRGRVEEKPKQRNNNMQYSLSHLSSRSQMVVVGEREIQNPMGNQLSTQTEAKNEHAANSKKEKSRRRGRKNNTISALVQERSVSKGGANKRNYGVSALMTLPSSTTKSNPQPFNPTSRKHRSRKPLSTNDDSICETMQYTGNPIVNDGDHLASLTRDVEALALRDARNSSNLSKSDPETHQIDQSSFAFQSEQRPTCNPPSSSPQRDQDDTITHNEQMTFSFTSPLKSPSFRSPFAIRHRNPNGFISPPSYIHRLSSLTNANIFQKSCSPFTDTNPLKRLDKKKTPAKLTPASPLVTEFCISPPAARRNRRSKDGVDRITDSMKIECTPSEQRQRTRNALPEMVNNVDKSFDIDGTERPLAAVISTINGSKLFDDDMDFNPTAVDSISRKEDKQQSHTMERNQLKEEPKNDSESHHKPGSAVLEVEEAIETNPTDMSGAIGSVVIEVEEAIPIDKLMSKPRKMDEACRDAIFLDKSRNGIKAMSKKKLGWQRKQPRTYNNTTEGGAIHKTTKKNVRRPKKQPVKSNNPIIEVECGHAKTQLRRSGRESKKTDRLTVAWNDHRKTNDRTSKLEAGVTIKSDRPHRLSAVCDDEVGNEQLAQRDVVDGGESNESDASIDHQLQESSDKLSVVAEDRVEEKLVSPCELDTITPTEDGSKSESLVTLDGAEPSSSLQWSNEEISSLRKAQTLVNPTSATFWEDIADLVAGRTSEECRDKWFSLIGTPNVRSKLGSRKNINVDEESSDNDEDDLFNSTPFRTTFTKTHSGNFAQKLREAEFDSCFGLSPCIKQHSTLESHLTDVSARKQRTGYNTYINNLRRDLSVLGNVSKKATKHHASTIREDVIRINSKNGSGKLLEDGTVKITVQEDESEEDDIYGFGDDDSLLDEDDE